MTGSSGAIVNYGECGLLAAIAHDGDLVKAGVRASAVADRLRSAAGVIEAVAGIETVALQFDADAISEAGARALFRDALAAPPPKPVAADTDPIVIPVAYGGDFGPDLDEVAADCGMSADAVAQVHAAGAYRVAVLGFAPGFSYLGPLDPRLRVERLTHPRTDVPAGSVALAGGFTGVYPLPSPGGWRIIGRTPRRLFDPAAADPFSLTPGARVRFEKIAADAFDERVSRP